MIFNFFLILFLIDLIVVTLIGRKLLRRRIASPPPYTSTDTPSPETAAEQEEEEEEPIPSITVISAPLRMDHVILYQHFASQTFIRLKETPFFRVYLNKKFWDLDSEVIYNDQARDEVSPRPDAPQFQIISDLIINDCNFIWQGVRKPIIEIEGHGQFKLYAWMMKGDRDLHFLQHTDPDDPGPMYELQTIRTALL